MISTMITILQPNNAILVKPEIVDGLFQDVKKEFSEFTCKY